MPRKGWEGLNSDLRQKLKTAFEKRETLIASDAKIAGRLFHGFTEGCPALALDLYDRTVVITSFEKNAESNEVFAPLCDLIQESIPRLRCILLKERRAREPQRQKGSVLFGSGPDREISEWDVRYKIDLRLNRDTGFYLDSANLRKWLIENACGTAVLNTFAYTGSLGMAALAGNARFVLQTDLNPRFLQLFSESATANGVAMDRYRILPGDFFHVAAALRRQNKLFDIAILDPPFFSQTDAGRVDQQQRAIQLMNKIRPLIADGGKMVVVNNALFLSGSAYLRQIEEACADGYLEIEEMIPVPESFFGGISCPENLPADPAPFNHATKIVVLGVRRKDGKNR